MKTIMKAMQWLSKLILSAVITSLICIVSTFWVVHTYVDMILEQYHLKSAVSTTPDWSKFVTHAGKQLGAFRLFGDEASGASDLNGTNQDKTQEDENTLPVFGNQPGTNPSNGQDVKINGGENGASNSQPQQPSTGSSSQRKPPEDAVAVFGHQNGITEGAGNGAGNGSGSAGASGIDSDLSSDSSAGKIVVSGEEFTKKKEQLSTDAKNKIFNLMVKRVPQTEMQNISKLIEAGITASELKEIEQLLQKHLKPEEYSQLLGLIQQQ
ncbi:MAG: hypothetical protein K0S39_2083 [Paenibacillus sp.]|jgi:hypothetical protein|nr:hypothetical protein [Paenibacillus sp.]